jgi:hypothetical protein
VGGSIAWARLFKTVPQLGIFVWIAKRRVESESEVTLSVVHESRLCAMCYTIAGISFIIWTSAQFSSLPDFVLLRASRDKMIVILGVK